MTVLRRTWVRRGLSWLATLIVALGGLVGVVVFFNTRDDSTFEGPAGPGRALPDAGDRHLAQGHPEVAYAHYPPASGPHAVVPVRRDGGRLGTDQLLTALERGNVVLFYAGRRPPAGLRYLQKTATGAFDPALARAGEAVILARRPGTDGVLALAWARRLQATGPRDARLSAFIDAWLGKGAQR